MKHLTISKRSQRIARYKFQTLKGTHLPQCHVSPRNMASRKKEFEINTLPETNIALEEMVVWKLPSFWETVFSGAMLVSEKETTMSLS